MQRWMLSFVFACFLAIGLAPPSAYAAADKPIGAFEYMEMKPLILPVITDRGVTQQVSLIVSLEVPYGKKAEVEGMSPRLADAYLQDLYGALGKNQAMMSDDVIDVQAVKKRLTNVTYKVLKEDQVHAVLLQVLQQRRMM